MKWKESLIVYGLVAIALLQMTGDLCNLAPLKGIGAATLASPAPKVFSSSLGLETFSSKYILSWKDKEERNYRVQLTPEITQHVQGPYNRRNVIGAVLAYGPILDKSETMKKAYDAVLEYTFKNNSPLLKEFGIEAESLVGEFTIEVIPKTISKDFDLELIKKISIQD